MIICICNNLSTRKIHEALAAGADDAHAVHAFHGCAENCGQCRADIEDALENVAPSAAMTPHGGGCGCAPGGCGSAGRAQPVAQENSAA